MLKRVTQAAVLGVLQNPDDHPIHDMATRQGVQILRRGLSDQQVLDTLALLEALGFVVAREVPDARGGSGASSNG